MNDEFSETVVVFPTWYLLAHLVCPSRGCGSVAAVLFACTDGRVRFQWDHPVEPQVLERLREEGHDLREVWPLRNTSSTVADEWPNTYCTKCKLELVADRGEILREVAARHTTHKKRGKVRIPLRTV